MDLAGQGKNPIVAYKAKTNSSVIDLSKKNHYKPEDFWEPVHLTGKKNQLILEPESFYIMMSKEKICIWPDLVGEMIAYEPNSGELRTRLPNSVLSPRVTPNTSPLGSSMSWP